MICSHCRTNTFAPHDFATCTAILRGKVEDLTRDLAAAREPLAAERTKDRYHFILDGYELVNLLWLIRSTARTHDTGDWHAQVRWKIHGAVGMNGLYSGNDDLDIVAKVVQKKPNSPLR